MLFAAVHESIVVQGFGHAETSDLGPLSALERTSKALVDERAE
jgi:hypothetical protein